MAPIIKLIVIFNLLWSEFVETNATFRSASTADRNVPSVLINSLQGKLKIPIKELCCLLFILTIPVVSVAVYRPVFYYA